MKCPHCALDLLMTERKNIEIDYCPKCRGVWLDRGELDKLIDSTIQEERQESYDNRKDYQKPEPVEKRRYNDDNEYYQQKHYKKKRGWLGEIFDFD